MEDIPEPSQTESTNPSLSASQELSDQSESPRPAHPYASDRVDLDKPRKAQHSPFFRIPRDVREIIYTHLLVSNITIRWPSARFEHGLSPSLLRTCALMYEEASPILYRHNVFDFGHPSDVTVFCSLMDAHNAKQITEATFRIQDRDFKKVWDPYLMSMDTSRSFMFDLPNLRHLLVVLQGSWWNFHLGPDDNLKEWPRNDVLRNLSRTLETIHRADVQLMCRVRVPQDHFDLLRRNYATDPMDEENSVLRCVGSTRLQTPARSVYSLSCVLELLSPADIPLY